MGKVIPLKKAQPPKEEPVATCPDCKGQYWFIYLDGFDDNFENVIAHECGDCGFKIEFDNIDEGESG